MIARSRGLWSRARTKSLAVLALAFAVVAGASLTPAGALAANDMGLIVDSVERVGNAICVSFHADKPFTPRLEDPLLRGMPATVTFEVGVWRKRAFWFDKLVLAYRSEHKVAFDPWSKSFRIRSGVNPPRTRSVATIDSLRSSLFTARRLPVANATTLDSTAAHHVSVKVVIRPLSTEDLGEIEDWLSGSDPGESGDRGLPAYLLEWAVNLSGLGERSAFVKGPRFVPALLSPVP